MSADRYELEEFFQAESGSGYVVTRKCGEASYDEVIARRAKILAREKKPHGIYHIGADGQRSRVK
jgi:hypothetical protein|tara:strand:- start:1506 stop:1700 length:195 start_codon:yes stop_codon:yes gene_type:complete